MFEDFSQFNPKLQQKIYQNFSTLTSETGIDSKRLASLYKEGKKVTFTNVSPKEPQETQPQNKPKESFSDVNDHDDGEEEFGEEEDATYGLEEQESFNHKSSSYENNSRLLEEMRQAKDSYTKSKSSLESNVMSDFLQPNIPSRLSSKNMSTDSASKPVINKPPQSVEISQRSLEVRSQMVQEQLDKTKEIEKMLDLQFVPGKSKLVSDKAFEGLPRYTLPGAKLNAKKKEVLSLIGYHDSEDHLLGGYTYDPNGDFIDDFKK